MISVALYIAILAVIVNFGGFLKEIKTLKFIDNETENR